MTEKTYETPCGVIHYWVDQGAEQMGPPLAFLPGLLEDHRLFAKQLACFAGRYPLFVWDAPGHAASRPFELTFALPDKAKWLEEIFAQEGIERPVVIGHSMGGCVGQLYALGFPQKIKGLIAIDSVPLRKEYASAPERWFLKRTEPVFRHYPWKSFLKVGTRGVATSEYGRELMREMLLTYDGDQEGFAKLGGHGFRIMEAAMEENLLKELPCPTLLICGEQDRVGLCAQYNRAWHEKTGIPIVWIEGAGHNASADEPERVNRLIQDFVDKL